MRLVYHIARIKAAARTHFGFYQFVEDQEELMGVDTAAIEVVVAILAIIEVDVTLRAAVMAFRERLDHKLDPAPGDGQLTCCRFGGHRDKVF